MPPTPTLRERLERIRDRHQTNWMTKPDCAICGVTEPCADFEDAVAALATLDAAEVWQDGGWLNPDPVPQRTGSSLTRWCRDSTPTRKRAPMPTSSSPAQPRGEGKPPRPGCCPECWGWTFHRDECPLDDGMRRPESLPAGDANPNTKEDT